MRTILTVLLRELRGYFNSVIGYLFLIAFIGASCLLYMIFGFGNGEASMRFFFNVLPFVMAVLLPALTMRLWAEERRQGTIELLMTFPSRSWQLVAGKFFGAWIFYLIALVLTAPLPLLLILAWGADIGPIFGSYLGASLAGGIFIAAGMFFSALTKEQVVAFILALIACLGPFVFMGWQSVAQVLDRIISVPSPGIGAFLRDGLTMWPHFASVQRGVIDLGDLSYFVVYTLAFLVLNHFVLESHVKFHARARAILAGGLVLMVAFFFTLNVGLWRLPRIDMTKNKSFTVSPDSIEIIKDLKAPVEITVYLTSREKLPSQMQTLERDIIDLLSELKAGSGNLSFKVVDPGADREEEEEYIEQGIKAFPVQAVEADSVLTKLIYSTIQIDYLDKQESIKNFLPDRLGSLEYDLMVLVNRMATEKQPHVTIFAPFFEVPDHLRALYMQMGRPIPPPKDPYSILGRILRKEGYRVSRIRLNSLETIPEDTDVLVVMGPENLNDRQRWEISRFLRSGKNVLFGIQTGTFELRGDRRGNVVADNRRSRDVGIKLLEGYGVGADERILMDENSIRIPIRMQSLPFAVAVYFPNHIEVGTDQINKDLPMTSSVQGLFYMWGSALKLDDVKFGQYGLKKTMIFDSSPQTWFVDADCPQLDPHTVRPPDKYEGIQPMAVQLEGTFPDVYEGQPVPLWPDDKEGKPEPAKPIKAGEARLIVVGSALMFSDQGLRIAVETGNANGILFSNMMDSVTMGGRLTRIRAKNVTPPRIPRAALDRRIFYDLVTTVLMPVVIFVLGLGWMLIRRNRREAYLRSLQETKS
jgi:ABC-type uncharacterized transport system involved in gliding motility auxiliary subunit/ABC-type transport system involved in multi-copper enzyme maturation permease subunit